MTNFAFAYRESGERKLHPARQRHKGFTMTEILVVLAIVSILALITIPLFSNIINKRRLALTADELFLALSNARTEAIKRNSNVYVSFNTGSTWCYGINVGSACNCTAPSTCNIKSATYAKDQQMTLSTSGIASGNFYFETIHGGASTIGTITFTLYADTPLVTISVSRLGNLQICSTGLSGYTAC